MAAQPTTTSSSHLPKHFSQLVPTITSLLRRNLNPQQNPPDPNFLNQFSRHLTSKLVIQIIKNQTSPNHALFFFNWASNLHPNPNNYFHNFHSYIAITDKLISHKLFSAAANLLESHNRFNDFMVGKFIKAHGDLGHLRWATKLFQHVKEREYGLCLYSYNSLLGVLVKAQKLPLAWGYFGQMIKEGVTKPDVSTYAIMMKGFCQLGMIEFAKKLFDEMGCEKNLYAYNTMVNGFCKKGLMENARRLVDEMIENGRLPDTVTYSTLIDGYAKKGEMIEAVRCFEEMVERKVELNVVTYNCLINGLCLNGNVEEAKKMMTRMRLCGLKDNLSTHMSLLKGYSAEGRSDEVIKHFKQMTSLGMELDEKSCAVIVNEYCNLTLPDQALTLLREMRLKGLNLVVCGLNVVLRCLLEMGELDKAVDLVKEMHNMGCRPNFISYSTVIHGLVRAKRRMQDVEILVNDMLKDGNRLDATLYNCLMTGYYEEGNEDIAVQVFREMIGQGYVISPECFEAFVKKMYAKGKLFEVENLVEQLFKRCPVSDINSYQKVLDEYSS